MKRTQISLDNNDLKILKEIYNIDLDEPSSLEAFLESSLETRKRLHDTERVILNHLYSNRKKRIPNGQKCSFCLKAENEVYAMAKHKSGFNLCSICIKRIRAAEED